MARQMLITSSNPDIEVHALWMTKCVMQMTFLKRRHIKLTDIIIGLCPQPPGLQKNVCMGKLMGNNQAHCMGLSLMHLQCYTKHREQFL